MRAFNIGYYGQQMAQQQQQSQPQAFDQNSLMQLLSSMGVGGGGMGGGMGRRKPGSAMPGDSWANSMYGQGADPGNLLGKYGR